MTWGNYQMILTFAVLGGVFLCFIKEWLPTDLVALGGLCVLLVTGVLDDVDLRRIFGNAAPLTIGAMFILGEALTRTGAIDWIAHRFEMWAGKSMIGVIAHGFTRDMRELDLCQRVEPGTGGSDMS